MSALPKWFFVGALLLALLTLASSAPARAQVDSPGTTAHNAPAAPDAPLPLNHFYCYKVTTTLPVNVTVKTQDQFDTRPRKTKVGDVARFCNPVEKTHNNKVFPILFPNDHLMLYNIGTHKPDPKLEVQVRNQFGVQQLAVFVPAEVLMVPTQKKPHEQPKDTDHFKCYFVQGQPVNVPVGLADQFQQTQTVVLQPFGLCNPTRKNHNGVWTEILHKDAHLVCYFVQPKDFSKTVKTRNQFRREKITTTVADILCVPSTKKVL